MEQFLQTTYKRHWSDIPACKFSFLHQLPVVLVLYAILCSGADNAVFRLDYLHVADVLLGKRFSRSVRHSSRVELPV